MSTSQPMPSRQSLRGKLFLFASVLSLGVAAIVIIVMVSNARLHELATQISETQVAELTKNAAVTREITALLSEVELIDRSFFGSVTIADDLEETLAFDGFGALRESDDRALAGVLERVEQSLEAYLQSVIQVVEMLAARQSLSDRIWVRLDALEQDLSDWLIEDTLASVPTDAIDQILALATGYRETMLVIERQHARAQAVYFARQTELHRMNVLDLVDDLYRRLQTLSASEDKIVAHGLNLMQLLTEYREAVDDLYRSLGTLGQQYDDFNEAKADTLLVTRVLSDETENLIEDSRNQIDQVFSTTGIIAVGLSALVVIAISIVTIVLIRRHFQRPLLDMTTGIRSFTDGNFSRRVELGRDDEWRSLEDAFNAMAENIERLLDDLSQEITSRENVEAELREQRRFLESILENIPSTIMVKDAKDLKYVRLNKAGEALFGFPRDQVIGKGDADLYPPDQAATWTAQDREVLSSTGVLMDIPDMQTTTDIIGDRALHSRKVSIVDDDGTPVYLLVIADDITEKIKADKVLHEALDSAERANKAKSEFLASMSHELRTPLNAIIGFAQAMIVQIFGPHSDPKYLEYSKDIEQSSSHLLSIINDILDLSKIEAGQVDLTPEPIELLASINECMKLVAMNDARTEDRFVIKIDDDMPQVMADRQTFRQILINLLSNADKYTPTDGEIRITARAGENDTAVVEIADTGVGIPEKDLDRVLEPFGQARSNVNVTHKGTGLGLSISNRLMELQGGTLSIDSTVDVGTTVTLTFPLTLTQPGQVQDQ